MGHDVKRRVMLKALEVVGDRERLAKKLGTRKLHLDSWLAGFTEPPDELFLRAADIILDNTVADVAAAESSDAISKRPH
jgi:hypothetical protein